MLADMRPENANAAAEVLGNAGYEVSVATVDAGNRVVLKTITIARDMGRTVEIGSGLSADDRIIESPQDGIATGDEVRIANSPASGTAPATVAKDQRRPPS